MWKRCRHHCQTFTSCSPLITQADLECTVGRGDVPGDILGTLVSPVSASGIRRLQGFGTQFVTMTKRDIYNNRVLNRVDA